MLLNLCRILPLAHRPLEVEDLKLFSSGYSFSTLSCWRQLSCAVGEEDKDGGSGEECGQSIFIWASQLIKSCAFFHFGLLFGHKMLSLLIK